MRYIFTSILGVVIDFCMAQGIITGRIVDEQSLPMEFANVMLVNHVDSAFIMGTVTKDDGTFTLQMEKQDGLLKVSSVGYQTQYFQA